MKVIVLAVLKNFWGGNMNTDSDREKVQYLLLDKQDIKVLRYGLNLLLQDQWPTDIDKNTETAIELEKRLKKLE